LQLLLDGNPLHEFTTSSMAKREEMKKQALSAMITKGSSDSLSSAGEKKGKVYTIGLLGDSGVVKPAASGSGAMSLLGYTRSVPCPSTSCHLVVRDGKLTHNARTEQVHGDPDAQGLLH
jgi:hypothetical protein